MQQNSYLVSFTNSDYLRRHDAEYRGDHGLIINWEGFQKKRLNVIY
jgi:hypothetical protein